MDGWAVIYMVMLLKYCYFTSAQQLQILSVFNGSVLDKQLQLNKLTCEVIISESKICPVYFPTQVHF